MTTIINDFKYENIDQMLNLQSKNNSKAYIQDWFMTFCPPPRLMIRIIEILGLRPSNRLPVSYYYAIWDITVCVD
jgi:hypothetical protein